MNGRQPSVPFRKSEWDVVAFPWWARLAWMFGQLAGFVTLIFHFIFISYFSKVTFN
jgi:hypothetical protein